MTALSLEPRADESARGELRDVVRGFLAAKAPVTRSLELSEADVGHDPEVWRLICEQLALPGLIVPDRYGGQGYGFAELAVVLEELGRVLYPGPLFATVVLAITALLLGDDEAARLAYLPALAAGARMGTAALLEPGRGWSLEPQRTMATRERDSWRIEGTKVWVLDGATADVVVVSADDTLGGGLFVVDGSEGDLRRQPAGVLDLTRRLATVTFTGARAVRIAGRDAILELRQRWFAAMACEQVGAAQACLEMTVAYAKDRLQFGRPIGSYQAVRHRCADMFAASEMAAAAARAAVRAIVDDAPDQALAVGVARSFCSEALLSIAEAAIQLHGGAGFTWELPVHLYFKRAKASALMGGDPAEVRAQIADKLLSPPISPPGGSAADGSPGPPEEVQRRVDALLETLDPDRGPDRAFRARQFDLGLAWAHLPEGEGGCGVGAAVQHQIDASLARAGVSNDLWRAGVGLFLVAPTLALFGSAAQRRRYLRPLFLGEEIWCQLFSEPGAGSDLAGLSTRAERRGDKWVINGQKVWTSLAHLARWGILCARTDLDAPKHAGLTYFIVDMEAAGVEVRPLRQITGEAEFDEVFLTDVVVGDEDVIGRVGDGWSAVLATLASERAAFITPGQRRGEGSIAHIIDLWHQHGDAHSHCRDRALELAVRAEALRLAESEAVAAETAGLQSASWSFLKLVGSELQQQIFDLAMTLSGPDGLGYDDYGMTVPDEPREPQSVGVSRSYLYARALTIAGGTSEIQRTIVADRVLRLPREAQIDRATPWREIPRN